MRSKFIKTSVTALYEQGYISYSPSKTHLEMKIGTNTTNYKDSRITLQKEETINIGVIEINNELYYGPERLFIELSKYNLESTVEKEALQKLEKVIDPEKTKKIYDSLKKKRRGLDHERIEKFLNENLLLLPEIIKKNKDKKSVVREYLMALVSRKEVPLTIIKGGTEVELFTTINRTTLDIDAHAGTQSIKNILDFLLHKNRSVYFKFQSDDEKQTFEKLETDLLPKKVMKFNLVPISRGGAIKKELEGIVIPISFNTNFTEAELKQFIKQYEITHRRLKYLNNSKCIIFTREMLLAEKFQSIISKPSSLTRTKDLIDLHLLWSNDINYRLFRKWLFRKWKNQRYALSENEAIELIKKNRKKELTKIKANFVKASKMYELNISYEECIELYNKLIKKSIVEL